MKQIRQSALSAWHNKYTKQFAKVWKIKIVWSRHCLTHHTPWPAALKGILQIYGLPSNITSNQASFCDNALNKPRKMVMPRADPAFFRVHQKKNDVTDGVGERPCPRSVPKYFFMQCIYQNSADWGLVHTCFAEISIHRSNMICLRNNPQTRAV